MSRKRDEFIPLGDVAETVELSGDRALASRAVAPRARRHFTRLDQVAQLVGVSEADPELGSIARLLALCSLPRTNPGNRTQYVRRNGPSAPTGGLDEFLERDQDRALFDLAPRPKDA